MLVTIERAGRLAAHAISGDGAVAAPIVGGDALRTRPVAVSQSILLWEIVEEEGRPAGRARLVRVAGASSVLRESRMERALAIEGEAPPLEVGFRCVPRGPCVHAERTEGLVRFTRFDPVSGRALGAARDFSAGAAGVRDWDVAPTGRSVAVVQGDSQVKLLALESGGVRTFTVAAATALTHVAFEPDGRAVLVAGRRGDRHLLLRSDLSGGATELLARDEGAIGHPVPSSDGAHVAFTLRSDESDVYRLRGL